MKPFPTVSERAPWSPSRRQLLRVIGAGALAVVATPLLAACGGAAGGQVFTVNMTDAMTYEPASLTIPRGASVTWRNTGAVVHTATDDPSLAQNPADSVLPSGAQPWNSGDVEPGGSWTHTFDTPGDYVYFCIPHEAAGMVGRLTVSE